MSILVKKFNSTARSSFFSKSDKSANIFLKKTLVLNIILAILIFVFLTFYLFKINQLIALGFRLNQLETTKEELGKSNKSLELEKMRLEALGYEENSLIGFDLVRAKEITYLKPITGATLTQK